LEEWDFLDETCLTALYASKDVSFAAVVDINGKLIIGKYRKRDRRISDICNINPATTVTLTCYAFYSEYLVKAIRRSYFEHKRIREVEKEEINFDMIDIDDNLKLAITPLTKGKDKYLCVYFESRVISSTQQIILKINNTI
jgi:hypothetical protein